MIAAAINKIQELCKPHFIQLGEEHYVVDSDGRPVPIRLAVDYAEAIELYSLDALVRMIETEALNLYSTPIYIEASDYDSVDCFLQPNGDLRFVRQELYNVAAKDIPGWKEEDSLPFEQALIAVRTRFQRSVDTAYLLKLLSEISNGAKVTFADNGIATTVVTKKGIDLQASEAIRPIISLKPYRTFQEIEQPASEFHIRISERGIKFIEADGGMWKLLARQTIVNYLSERLANAVADGRVVVML